MKYFVTDEERTYTGYHEFYNGKWDGKTFWKNDSISLDDEVLRDHLGFYRALKTAIPNYDPYDNIEVSKDQWVAVGEAIPADDTGSLDLYAEADQWLQSVFETHGCFTILGL